MALTKVPSNLDATIATTQSQADNSTNIATTAYVDLAISNLSDSAPAALNTLNEIAAALGDDANYASTTTAAIAAKLPLAGGTMTGNLVVTSLLTLAPGSTNHTNHSIHANSNGYQYHYGGANGLYLGDNSDLSNAIGIRNANFIDMQTGGVERMRIDASGNVGIGTNAPAEMLNVESDSASPAILVKAGGQTSSTSPTAELILSPGSLSTNDSACKVIAYRTGDYSSAAVRSNGLRFQTTNANAAVTAMTIDNAGNVGIGTTSPSHHLHISGTGGQRIKLEKTDAGGDVDIELAGPSDSTGWLLFKNTTSGNNSGVIKYVHNGDYMSFRTNGTDDRMRILSNGKVGIGTASPDTSLHVNAAGSTASTNIQDGTVATFERSQSTAGAYVAIIGATNGVSGLHLGDPDNDDIGNITYNHSANRMEFSTNAAERMRIDSSGNVGIGTGTPSGKLHVTKEGANTEVEALRLENSHSTMSNYQPNHAVSLGFGLAAYEGGTRDSRLAAKIVGRKGGAGGNDWYTNGASSNFQGELNFYTRKDDVLANKMTLDENGDLTLGGSDVTYNVLTVGRTGTSGQGTAHLKMKTQGASYMDWWDAGAGNTIRLHTHSVNLRMVDQPNGDPCIQFEAAGNIDIDGSYLSGGFDYAEYFESTDGTAIPVGTSVVLVNEKVRAATSGEQPLGVVRPGSDGTSVVGGAAHLKWDGKYLKDDYDAYLYDTVDYWTWKDVGDTNETGDEDQQCWSDRVPAGWVVPSDKTVTPMQRKRLNPDFVENLDADGNQIYVNREERDEWNCIGLLGQVPITKGQVTNSNWTKLKDRSSTVELWFIK